MTAAMHYNRAGLCYGRGQHLIPVDGHPRKKEYYAGVSRCFDKMREIRGGDIQKHQVEFDPGKNAYFYFWPAEGEGHKPTVLLIPGMDMIKEDGLLPYNNWFHARGMNFAIMDGPGQGECNINQVWVDHTNYARAGSRVIDWLTEREEVDSSRSRHHGHEHGNPLDGGNRRPGRARQHRRRADGERGAFGHHLQPGPAQLQDESTCT